MARSIHQMVFYLYTSSLCSSLMTTPTPRLDRKIEIPLPNEQARMEVLKIHAGPITKHGEVDYEAVVKLSDGSVTRLAKGRVQKKKRRKG